MNLQNMQDDIHVQKKSNKTKLGQDFGINVIFVW